jgi:hypothetical protein
MNRALQLDAALTSFFLHCKDAQWVDLVVIWKATQEIHTRQYNQLIEEYNLKGAVSFTREVDFRQDLLGLLAAKSGLSPDDLQNYRQILRMGRFARFFGKRYLNLSNNRFIMFLVDDNLFVKPFRLGDALNVMNQQPQSIGFSLRLGMNTTHCYTMDCAQKVPEFSSVAPGILVYDWTKAELDFHYPLEISSSIYRMREVLPLINGLNFRNPNQLESRMSMHRRDYTSTHPYLLCFERSVTFCNPINRVQQVVNNKVGYFEDNSTIALADKFYEGKRIDVQSYTGFVPQACHQEVSLKFQELTQESNAN